LPAADSFSAAGHSQALSAKTSRLAPAPLPAAILLLVIIPALYQSYIVLPEELGREKEYINHNIRHTGWPMASTTLLNRIIRTHHLSPRK
jgi:uncharacterized membrane protein (UPF0182 family)